MESSSGSIDESSIGNLRISTDEKFTVGIELGASYCSIGIWDLMEEKYELIYKCRSSVFFEDGVDLVREDYSLETIAQNTILEVTSFLGRKSSDLNKEDYFPYKMVEGSLLRPVVSVTRNGHGHMFTPEELCAIILRKLKTMGETRLQRSVNKVVICVPSSFGSLQRQATLDAAAIAGLEVLSLIDETTSIGVAYYTLKKPISRRRLIIAHMGLLSFDICIIEYMKNGKVRVLAKCSEESLGFHNYISRVMAFCIKTMDRTPTMEELVKLKIESERAIFQLSSSPSTKIDFHDMSVMLTREFLHELQIDLVERTENHVRHFFYKGGFYSCLIECNSVLSGAILTLPKLGEQLKAYFNGKAVYDPNVNTSEFVSRGAAIHAAYHCEFKGFWSFEVVDVTRQAIILGAPKCQNWSVSIPMGTKLPKTAKEPLFLRTSDTPSSLILTLYEGPTSPEYKYSFLFAQGFQSINVCLEIDINGILKVYAEKQTSKDTIVSVMANYKPLSTEDILLFMEKAKRLDLELLVITTEEYSARHTELSTSCDRDSSLVGEYKMNVVLDASKESSLAADGAKALSRYTKMVDDVIRTQSQKIKEGSELALARLNKMNIDGSILALEGQATLPPLLREDVEAVQVSGGTAGLEIELQKLQDLQRLNHELLVQVEEQIQFISEYGTRRSIPQSSTLANTIQDRLSGLAARLKQAADRDGKIERSVRDHMELMFVLDSRPIGSTLPTLATPLMFMGANEKSIVEALKQSLNELERLGAQREVLEAKLKDMKREDILPQLITLTGSYEDLLGKEMLKYDHICEEISQNLHAQDNLLLQIQTQNNHFASTFNVQEYMDSLESCYKNMELAIAKYREIRENINEGLIFYATLQQEIRNLKQDTERQMSGLIDKDSRNTRFTQPWPRCSMVPCSNSSVFEEDTDFLESDTIDSVDAPRAPTPLISNSRHPDGLLGLDLDVPKGSAIEESNTLALPIVTSGFQETSALK